MENTSESIARHVGLRHGEGHGMEVVVFFAVAEKKKVTSLSRFILNLLKGTKEKRAKSV